MTQKISDIFRCGGSVAVTITPITSDAQTPNNSFWVDASDNYKLKWKDSNGVSKEVSLI